MSLARSRGSTNVGPAFPAQQRTAWWRSHGCIWSFRWTCLHHATESASFIIILHLLCEGPCCNKCNLGVLRLVSRWSWQGSALTTLTWCFRKCFRNKLPSVLCIRALRSHHIFHPFHHSFVLWNTLNSASLLCTVWKGRKGYSSNQSSQFHSDANLYTVFHRITQKLLRPAQTLTESLTCPP